MTRFLTPLMLLGVPLLCGCETFGRRGCGVANEPLPVQEITLPSPTDSLQNSPEVGPVREASARLAADLSDAAASNRALRRQLEEAQAALTQRDEHIAELEQRLQRMESQIEASTQDVLAARQALRAWRDEIAAMKMRIERSENSQIEALDDVSKLIELILSEQRIGVSTGR